jgi:DNA-binding CsgD family transcriptional regulator
MCNQTARALQSRRESDVGTFSLQGALQQLGSAVILLDRKGHVVFVSRKAHALTALGECLRIVDGHLIATDPSACAALRALILATLDSRTGANHPQQFPVLIRLGTGGVYRVSALGLSHPACRPIGGGVHHLGALVFIRTVHGDTGALARVLTQLYGLTHAEIRLALLLHEGRPLTECARANAVSIETVRAQLKSIFQKAGLHRQSQFRDLLNEFAGTD